MADIKKILEINIEHGMYETLGELYGMYYMEDLLFKDSNGVIFDKSREAFEELKRNVPIWKEKYGFDENTKLKDILTKIQ